MLKSRKNINQLKKTEYKIQISESRTQKTETELGKNKIEKI